jgi:hypothetical protein
MFSQCSEITGPGSRIAFSYFSTGPDGRPDAGPYTGLMLWLEKVIGEPWLWSIRPEELGTFLESTGWKNVLLPETSRKYGVEFFAIAEH